MEGTRPEGDYGVVSVFDRTNGIRMVEVARFRWKCAARDLGEVAYFLHNSAVPRCTTAWTKSTLELSHHPMLSGPGSAR